MALLPLCAICTGAAAPGTTPPPPATTRTSTTRPASTTPADLTALIDRLKAGDWATRAKAQEQIAKIGEDARPALERLLKSDADIEAVEAARTLLARLGTTQRYGPTSVTLHLKGIPAPDALAALAAQAKVTFSPEPASLWPGGQNGDSTAVPRVTLDCDHVPFWAALQQICVQAGVRLVSSAPGAAVQLAAADANLPAAPYAVAGPFLLKVKRIERTGSVVFDGPRDFNAAPGCRISLFVWGEPKMGKAAWSVQSLDELSTDAAPAPGKAFDKRKFFGGGGDVGGMSEGRLSFNDPVPGTKMARLALTARFTLVERTQMLEVDKVLGAARLERVLGGYPFVLKDVNKVGDGRYAYTIEVRPGDHSPDEFSVITQQLQRNRPRLLDAQGQSLWMSGGSTTYGQDKYVSTQEFRCDPGGNGKKVGPPVKFQWDVPVEVRTLTLPVEFKDLPLP
ncbi:MAG TPA: HEAT repeat domain-containing protein [Tepidisphaeraceae bacterium]|jgi:hypothetical protein